MLVLGLIGEFSQEPDRRLADLMWELLAYPKVEPSEAESLYRGLMMAYLGQRYYSPTEILPSDRRDLAKAAENAHDDWWRHATSCGPDALDDRRCRRSGPWVAIRLGDDPKLGESLRSGRLSGSFTYAVERRWEKNLHWPP